MHLMYDPELVKPMKEELTKNGVQELKIPEDVDNIINRNQGTLLIMVNSVCGCAAGSARPGLILALKNKKIPDNIVTVFAGVDREATEQARKYFKNYLPSSPSMFLFKDQDIVFALQRHDIEGKKPEEISKILSEAFNKYC